MRVPMLREWCFCSWHACALDETLLMRDLGVHVLGRGLDWIESLDSCGKNSGSCRRFFYRHPEGVLVLMGLSSRSTVVVAFQCFLALLPVASLCW